MRFTVTLNGSPRVIEAEADERVKDVLRREGILSVRDGCDGQGTCGSCSVLLDGRTVNSCLLLCARSTAARSAPSSTWRDRASSRRSRRPSSTRAWCSAATARRDAMAVRLLHAGDAARHRGAARAARAPDARAGAGRALGHLLPLHRLRAVVRRGRAGGERRKDPALRGGRRRRSSATTCGIVGKPARKVDGPRLVRGEQAFVEDMVRPGHCHLKMLGSPARARLHQAHRHVAAPRRCRAWCWSSPTRTARTSGTTRRGRASPSRRPTTARCSAEKVLHVGDRVAAVVAETRGDRRGGARPHQGRVRGAAAGALDRRRPRRRAPRSCTTARSST